MPQIPSYGGPQVSPNIVGYQPFSTNIPRVPESPVPKAIARASRSVDALATKFAEDQDNARVTAALTALRRHAVDVESGENGYRGLLGENALRPDEQGRGLVERVDTDMQSFGQSLMADLTPRQQRLFSEKAQPIYLQSYDGASRHVFDQGIRYQQESAEAAVNQSVEEGAANARSPDRLTAGLRSIEAQADTLARLRGYSPEQRAAYVKQKSSAMYMNAITRILSESESNPSAAYAALGILEREGKNMLGSDAARARVQIEGYLETAERYALAEGFVRDGELATMARTDAYLVAATGGMLSSGELSSEAMSWFVNGTVAVGGGMQENHEPGTPDRIGISKLDVETARRVAKEHGIAWSDEAFLEDRGYNWKLGALYMNRLEAVYGGDRQKAFAAYHAGEKAVNDAIKSAEKGEGSWIYELPASTQDFVQKCETAMRDAVRLAPKDSNGNTLSSFDPGYAMAESSRTYQTEKEARAYIRARSPRAQFDPVFEDQCVSTLMGRVNEKKRTDATEQQRRMAELSDAIYRAGGDLTKIPKDMWGRYTFNEQQDAFTLAKKVARGEDSTDVAVYMRFMEDDAALLALSPDQVKNLRGSLSEADFGKVVRRYHELKVKAGVATDARSSELKQLATGRIPEAYGELSISSIKSAADQLVPGYRDLVKDSPEAANGLIYVMADMLARQDAARGTRTKGDLNVYQALLPVTRNIVNVQGMVFGAEKKNVLALKPSDLPNTGPTDAKELLGKITTDFVGHDEPSDLELQNTLWRLFVRRDFPVNMTGLTLDQAFVSQIQEARRNSGRPPLQGADLIRAYFIERLNRTSAPEDDESTQVGDVLSTATPSPYDYDLY